MSKIAIPFYSASGHTRCLAEAVLRGVKTISLDACLIDVGRLDSNSWKLLEQADGIIFGSPTFMLSIGPKYLLTKLLK